MMWLVLSGCTWIGDAELEERLDPSGAGSDRDGDGYANVAAGGDDCWDDPSSVPYGFGSINGFDELAAADVHPFAADAFYDDVDANCGGESDFDQDLDGFDTDEFSARSGSLGDDCDDELPGVHPDQSEVCADGLDNDCDGTDATECSLSDAAVQYTGAAGEDAAGWSVSGVGDVNADGYDDLLIGAPGNDESGSAAGAAYLVLGRASPASSSLVDANAAFTGAGASDAGYSVSGAGDVNADGYDDMLIGAPSNDEAGRAAGAAYLVLGSADPASLGLSSAAGQYTGDAAGDYAGYSVSGAGDVNSDGFDDILVGASAGAESAGAAYLIFGGATPASLGLSEADAVYSGAALGSQAGFSVSDAGDVTGDGDGDLLIAAPYFDEERGVVYLLLGEAAPGSFGLSSAQAQYIGEAEGDLAGGSVSGAGDVNADGYDDMLIGAPFYGGDAVGAAYLLLGAPFPASLLLSEARAQFTGEAIEDLAGVSVSGAGDVDSDGHADMLIGAQDNDAGGSDAGAAYLVFGGATPASLGLTNANAQYTGEAANDIAGYSVSGAGDMNGDGRSDILISGENNDDGPARDAGAAYLILGF